MALGFPARVKFINMQNQRRERVWATRIIDRQLIDVTPLDGDLRDATLKEERNPQDDSPFR